MIASRSVKTKRIDAFSNTYAVSADAANMPNEAYMNEFNMKRIEHSRRQARNGEVIFKTSEELGLDDE